MREWTLHLVHGRALRVRRILVMAILNATPDSFSDGGLVPSMDDPGLRRHVRALLASGADILDVGGESTRPGHTPVPADEQWRRIAPVLEAIRAVAPEAAVSVDTQDSEVARRALASGAGFVNDTGALQDPGMAPLVAQQGCSIVLMRRGDLQGPPLEACRSQLETLAAKARAAGVPRDHCILDPGLGFGTPPGGDPGANLALVRGVRSYADGHPVLIGASRKRFVSAVPEGGRTDDRLEASLAVARLAVASGAAIVRAHDVAETVRALRP